ncbi:unknown [Odoribacter sp. CAG:788]|nr:unknown [Odoribacter sp. CAG:788]
MKKRMIAFVSACFLTLAVVAVPMYFQLSCGKIIYSDSSYYDNFDEMIKLLIDLDNLNC